MQRGKGSGGELDGFFEKIKEAPSCPCPRCDAEPGKLHQDGCGIECCPYCGNQLLSCCCSASADGVPDDDRMPWSGQFTGEAECREFGWYAKFIEGKGWVPCRPDDPEASPDLNRLRGSGARWDREQKRFVRVLAEQQHRGS